MNTKLTQAIDSLSSDLEELNNEDELSTEQPDTKYVANVAISQYKTDMGFVSLMQGFDKWIYVLPRYQRKYVWSFQQVESLAISLIKNMPIPPIYVYKNEYGQMEILDGQQRLFSLFLYYKGIYFKTKNARFSLQKILEVGEIPKNKKSFYDSLKASYEIKDVTFKVDRKNDIPSSGTNINYSDLTPDVQNAIDFRTISVIEIRVDDTKDKNRILYKIFENLNSGGTPLSNQEVRNGVFQSEFYDMLHSLNSSNRIWRKTFGGEEHIKSKDVELLLRFCATTYYFKMNSKGNVDCCDYVGSYPKLLNDFSEVAMTFSKDTIKKYEKDITKFLESLEVAGLKLPSVLLESLYFVSYNMKKKCKITDSIVKEILDETEYKEHARTSSTKSYMEKRYEDVYRILSKYAKSVSQ